jgi:hypothetical protein
MQQAQLLPLLLRLRQSGVGLETVRRITDNLGGEKKNVLESGHI